MITWTRAFIITDMLAGAIITISLARGFMLGACLGAVLLGVSLGVAARMAQRKGRR